MGLRSDYLELNDPANRETCWELYSVSFANLEFYKVVLSHRLGILVSMNSFAVNGACVNEARLLAPSLPVREATADQLQERIQSTIRAQNQVAAIRAEALAELRRREGTVVAESVLREDGLLARRRARSEIEIARELEGLPKTREVLRKGQISYDCDE